MLHEAGLAMIFIGLGFIAGGLVLRYTWARPRPVTVKLPEAIGDSR